MVSKQAGIILAAIALCILTMGTFTSAAETSNESGVSDIQLGRNGTLNGQVVDRQGQPETNSTVTLLQGDREIAQATTDADGKFTIAKLNTGIYHLEAAGQTSAHRLWAAKVAPPAAHRGVLVVSGPPAIRGRIGRPFSRLGRAGKMALFAASGYFVVDKYFLDDKKPAS